MINPPTNSFKASIVTFLSSCLPKIAPINAAPVADNIRGRLSKVLSKLPLLE